MGNLVSLIISLTSLMISILALTITRRIYYLSSKDYFPEIDFVEKKEIFKLLNRTRDIYKVSAIHLLKIETYGFEDHKTNKICKVSFLTKSKIITIYGELQNQKTLKVSFDDPGPCAYLCPYNENLVEELSQKISNDYSIDSELGYALPSIRSVCFIIVASYKNRFLEMKSAIFKYQHFHGHGFEKLKISQDELEKWLTEVNIPNFESLSKLWHFLFTDKWKLS